MLWLVLYCLPISQVVASCKAWNCELLAIQLCPMDSELEIKFQNQIPKCISFKLHTKHHQCIACESFEQSKTQTQYLIMYKTSKWILHNSIKHIYIYILVHLTWANNKKNKKSIQQWRCLQCEGKKKLGCLSARNLTDWMELWLHK